MTSPSEERYRHQLRLFEAIAESTPDFFSLIDTQGRIVYANRPLLAWWGRTRDETIGRSLHDLGLDAERVERSLENVRRVVETRDSVRALTSVVGENGETRDLEYILAPVLNADGQVDLVAGTTRDITELRRAALAREQLAAHLQLALDSAEMGWWRYDPVSHATTFDRRFAEIFGIADRPPGERDDKLLHSLIHPDDRQGVLTAVAAALDPVRPQPYSKQIRLTLPDGSVRHVEAHGLATFEGTGPARRAVSFVGTMVDVTEQKRIEQSLRASEASLRLLADSMPQIVWVTRPDGYHEYYNRRWYEFTGVPFGSTQGDGWNGLFHPDDQQRAWQRWNHSLTTGEPYEIEYRLRHHTGEYRWALGRALPVRDAQGRIERWYGTCTDIHDQKLSEEALRRSREQLELVVRGANVGVWYCPLPFSQLIWDDTAKAHFHLPPDAGVTIETFYDRLHPDDRESVRRSIEQSIVNKESYDIDYRTVSPDGSNVKWIRASGRPFHDDSGNAVRFDGITLDVTERIHAQEQIREETFAVETINRVGRSLAGELDLARLVQTITDATTELTGAQFGAFFYNVANDAGESYSLYALSGVDRAHFDKFPMPRNTDIFAPTFGGEGIVRLDDVIQDPRYGRNAPHHGMPKGHLPVRSYLAVPVKSRSGEVLGGIFFGHAAVGVFTERAERIVLGIAAQAAIAIDNARLFEAARRANAEKDKLLESERVARGEAERASRMKDEFLANLSHELRTPLNAILGWAQILRTSAAKEDLDEGVAVIERNARAQTQIIEDLLDMSRIISGKLRLDVVRLDPANVVKDAVETVRPAALAKGIRLQTILDPLAGPISGDPSRLQQVFWNLLTNAVKFTPRGGRVQVLLERVNSHLEISVIDTGDGIDPAFLPHVFDRFRQADASTTRRHGGLGLGLAIVKQLVELHGGTVRVKSGGAGFGSTFTIALPLIAIHQEPADTAERRHPAAPDAIPVLDSACFQLAGVKVLVVDDEPDAREVVRRLLADCHAIVTTAGSAQEAIDRMPRDLPHVLVSDIGMPGEDGYSLIRRVRALPDGQGGKTPAVALTAYARAEDRMKAVLAGFQHHVVKPVEPAELITMVASLAEKLESRVG